MLTAHHYASTLASSKISDPIHPALRLSIGQVVISLPPDPGTFERPRLLGDLRRSSIQLDRLPALDVTFADIPAALLAREDVDATDYEGLAASIEDAGIRRETERWASRASD